MSAPELAIGDDEAVAGWIESLGCTATRDEQQPTKPVVEVRLGGVRLSAESLRKLAALRNLQSLDLSNTGLTDPDLKELAGLRSLRSLNLRYNRIGDIGLKELATLNNLEAVTLDHTQITDAG